jgi:hypothetical protein
MQPTHIIRELLQCRIMNWLLHVSLLGMISYGTQSTGIASSKTVNQMLSGKNHWACSKAESIFYL